MSFWIFFLILPFVILLPITRAVAPFLKACLGVIILFWSSLASPKILIPGVIISFLKTLLTTFISCGLQTIASNFALAANLAWCKTNFLTSRLKPISFKDLLSNEVRIVTPIIFVRPATFFVALIASRPELIWMVI